MKKMICEICSSQKFKKENNVFICLECGTEYSIEEAKKLLTEVEVEDKSNIVESDNSKVKEQTLVYLSSWLNLVRLFNGIGRMFNKSASNSLDYCHLNAEDFLIKNKLILYSHIKSVSSEIEYRKNNICNTQGNTYLSDWDKKQDIEFDNSIIDQLSKTKYEYFDWRESDFRKEKLVGITKLHFDFINSYNEEFINFDEENNGEISKIFNLLDPLYRVYVVTNGQSGANGILPVSLYNSSGKYDLHSYIEHVIGCNFFAHYIDSKDKYDNQAFYGNDGLFAFHKKGTIDVAQIKKWLKTAKTKYYSLFDIYYSENIAKTIPVLISSFDEVLKSISALENDFFLPFEYRNEQDIVCLLQLFVDGKASSWKEAMNLYDEKSFRDTVLRKLDNIENAVLNIQNLVERSYCKLIEMNATLKNIENISSNISIKLSEANAKINKINRNTFITAWNTIDA